MRQLLGGALLLTGMIALAVRADAIAVRPGGPYVQQPGPTRVAVTDLIVAGRVMGIEDMDVKVPVAPNSDQKTTWRIAVVGVTEVVKGNKETKQVRVGYMVGGAVGGPFNGPGGGPVVVPGGPAIQPVPVPAPMPLPPQGGGVQPAPAPNAPAVQPLPPQGGAQAVPAPQVGQAQVGQAQPGQVIQAQPAQVAPAVQPVQGGPKIKPLPAPVPPPFDGPVGYGGVQLQIGQDGLFYLTKHPQADFYILNTPYDFVPGQNKAQFDNELKQAQQAGKILDNPMQALKSADAKERYFAACLLITLYRTPQGSNKTELVSMEESKLILTVLANDGNWKNVPVGPGPGGPPIKKLPPIKGGPVKPGVQPAVQQDQPAVGGGVAGPGKVVPPGGPGIAPQPVYDPMNALNMFNMLGVTQQDGFTPPVQVMSPDDYANACRDWCTKNAGTYQIKRFVK